MTDQLCMPTTAPLPRPEVYFAPSIYHGGLDYVELEMLRLMPDEVLDFSVNSNPFGPSPYVRQALASVPLDRYPDREALALRRALAARLRVRPNCIIVGNGAAELFWLIALAYVNIGDSVLILSPTFGEYERAAYLQGAKVHRWTARAEDHFIIAEEEVSQRLEQLRPRLVFICNPNNPTGTVLSVKTLEGWCRAYPDTLFVVDESYHAFAIGFQSAVSLRYANLLVVRSMTKDYALAALRLGYAVGAEGVIEALRRVRPEWNVNALAQAAGLAALSDEDHLRRSLEALHAATRVLRQEIQALGWRPLHSAVHFFLMHVGNGAAFRSALLQYGILVRDCQSFGLPAYVRIAPRRPEENARLIAALREVSPAFLKSRDGNTT